VSAAPAILAALEEAEALADEVVRLRNVIRNLGNLAGVFAAAAEDVKPETAIAMFTTLGRVASDALEQT
jgi:hypothetical protein